MKETGVMVALVNYLKSQRGLSGPFQLGELLGDGRVEAVPAKLSKRC